jgi:hypothetical protein
MPTTTHPLPRLEAGEVQEAFADAVVALERCARLARAEYEGVEHLDSPVARDAHAALLYAEVALTALRAAGGDEAAREALRQLTGWPCPCRPASASCARVACPSSAWPVS